MPRLTTFAPERRVFAAPHTGREVIQMTAGDGENWGAYAALCPFDAHERYLLFDSNRTGRFEIYRVAIDSGEITQLSDRDGVSRERLNVPPPGREVLYSAGASIWAVDIETGEERLAVDASGLTEALGSYLTFSPDGSKVLIHYTPRDGEGQELAVAAIDGSFIEPVFRREEPMQHPRWVPGDDRTVSFSVSPDRQNDPDETYERRARSWQLDIETGEAFPLLVMPPGWRCTHEFWSPDGSRIYAHRKHVPNWVPASIVSVPKSGDDITTHYTDDELLLGHSAVNADDTKIVIDVQTPNDNPLLLLDVASGAVETLCRPNAGISKDHSTYAAHPHPSFSPSGRWISYTSDTTGTPQLYLVSPSDD